MKKKLLSVMAVLTIGASASFLHAQKVLPYLPEGAVTTSVEAATFAPPLDDYTLQVEGIAGTEISVAGGTFTYTPEATGNVRFAQRNGIIYVYEGNVYKTTLTPVSQVTYPAVTDEDPITNNLLQNASFETLGELVGGSNYQFGAPWVTNVTVNASGGIRVSTNASAVHGSYVCVWRGSGNDNYLSQPVSGIEPNTYYQVVVRQVASGNANANFNFGLGSAEGGLDYAVGQTRLGIDGYEGSHTIELYTSATTTADVYFTLKNTNPNSANQGSDPVVQIDYLALVKGVPATGITGATAPKFVEGTAYAPENLDVDFEAGDYYDMNSFIVNPDFEQVQADRQATIPGWTKGGASNSEYCTRNDAGPLSGTFKHGNVYFQYWAANGANADFDLSQEVTGLPDGKYTLMALAGSSVSDITGTFLYAGETQVEITTTGEQKVENVTVVGGNLTIGFKSISRNHQWAFADNFRLAYTGPIQEKVLSVSPGSLFLTEIELTATFTVTGANFTAGDEISLALQGSTEGISFPATIAGDDADLATGKTITVTFDPAAGATASDTILITSGDIVRKVAVATSKDSECFTQTHPEATNLATDPTFINASAMQGWGNRSLLIDTEKAYCGASCAFINGGSYDQALTAYEASTEYVAYAMINPNGNTIRFGAHNLGQTDMFVNVDESTTTGWQKVTLEFTTGETLTSSPVSVHFNGASAAGAYIDNLEIYKKSEIIGTSVSTESVEDFRIVSVSDGVEIISDNTKAVSIYAITGQLVKQLEVPAGKTPVALTKGMYIINGQKVIVK